MTIYFPHVSLLDIWDKKNPTPRPPFQHTHHTPTVAVSLSVCILALAVGELINFIYLYLTLF